MSKEEARFRMDFFMRVVGRDAETGAMKVEIIPDSRRYERRLHEGQWCLFDKLDHSIFPEQLFYESVQKAISELPLTSQRQGVGDAQSYVASRRPIIERLLDGTEKLPPFQDKSEEFLQSLATDKLGFVIICVDIVGSTKLATTGNSGAYEKVIIATLYELSDVVPRFLGHVLKYTGDGLISYFPEPSFITKHDLSIDCALTMQGLVRNALNPVFRERGLPAIDIRIGIDSGQASIIELGSPETKRHKDIIGATVSLAAKIQGQANPGDIFLGDAAVRNLYTSWRLICESVEPKGSWDYKDNRGNIYRIHRVKPSPSRSA